MTADGAFKLNSGSGRAFAFSIAEGETKMAVVVHSFLGQQDFSLRCWISRSMAGSALILPDPNETLWHARRVSRPIISIYDEALERPELDLSAAVPPGDYFINVLNLTNSANEFIIQLTE